MRSVWLLILSMVLSRRSHLGNFLSQAVLGKQSIHPLVRLLFTQPQVVAQHAAGYVGLAQAQVLDAAAHVKQRVIRGVIAVIAALVALMVSSIALLLWAVVPAAQWSMPWMLWLVPLVFWLVAAWGAYGASRPMPKTVSLATLRQQAEADMAVLRHPAASTQTQGSPAL